MIDIYKFVEIIILGIEVPKFLGFQIFDGSPK